MTRRYYAVLTRTDMPIIPYHVHAFDSVDWLQCIRQSDEGRMT